MSITAAERRAIPAADWGDWRGSPELSKYPIRNQDDLDAAVHLIGKAGNPEKVKAKLIAIATRKKLTLPDAWQEHAGMSAATVHFDAAPLGEESRADNGMVVRSGLLFRAGDYPSHGYAMTPAELADAATDFTGGYVELEHFTTQRQPSILDGKLGRVNRVWLSDDGTELHGEVAIPEWIDRVAADAGRKVSAVWNRATKRLRGVGLVLNPAVSDAAVMSAYATFAGNRHSKADQADIQAIHDYAMGLGATCTSAMSGARHSKADMATIQQVHDVATKQGAVCAPEDAAHSRNRGGKPMHLDSIAFWRKNGRRFREEARDQGITTIPDEEVFSILDSEAEAERERVRQEELASFAAKQEEAARDLKAAKDALLAANAQRMQVEASSFADGLIVGGKLSPAEREQFIATFSQAAQDDAQHGAAMFSGDAGSSRVEALKKLYEVRPAHTWLNGEQVAGAVGFALPSGQGGQPAPVDAPTPIGKPISEERKKRLRALSNVKEA